MDVGNNDKSSILVENELKVDDCKENISGETAKTSMTTNEKSDPQILKYIDQENDLGKKEKCPVTIDEQFSHNAVGAKIWKKCNLVELHWVIAPLRAKGIGKYYAWLW